MNHYLIIEETKRNIVTVQAVLFFSRRTTIISESLFSATIVDILNRL